MPDSDRDRPTAGSDASRATPPGTTSGRPGGSPGLRRSEGTFGATSIQIRQVLSYVPAVARRYAGCGVALDELIAAGNLGLVEAALRFDRDRKVKFITYADWWIRKAILETIAEQSGPVRLPRYQQEKLRTINATRADLVSRSGEEPDGEQLAKATGLSRQETDALLRLAPNGVSLEHPVGGDTDRPLRELLADSTTECPHRRLVRRDLAEHLHRHVAALEKREASVIRLRFGLDGEPPLTLREAGARLGISRERVRQLELRALTKLKPML